METEDLDEYELSILALLPAAAAGGWSCRFDVGHCFAKNKLFSNPDRIRSM
jgi:hypothetical protein